MRIRGLSSDVCSSDLRQCASEGSPLDPAGSHQEGFHRGLQGLGCLGEGEGEGVQARRAPAEAPCQTGKVPHVGFVETVAVSSEASRVGKECGSTWRSRWSAYRNKKTSNKIKI